MIIWEENSNCSCVFERPSESSVGKINKEKSEDRPWPEGFGKVQAKLEGLQMKSVVMEKKS